MMALSQALAQRQTQSLADAFRGGFIRVFGGAQRAAPDQAETGTLLGVVSTNGVDGAGLHLTATGATLTKTDAEWVFQALANGTATWFSLVTANDTGGNSLSALRIDGSIGTPAAPGDMTWKARAVTKDRFYTINRFTYLLLPI